MAAPAELTLVLRRVRRRLRLVSALQSAVLAGLCGAAASAMILAASWWTGRALILPVCVVATVLGCAALGAAVAAARRIPLARCARAVDGAIGDRADRTLSALALSAVRAGPFVDAVVRDAMARAGRTAASAAAPIGRPRGVPALAAGALVLAALFLVPPRQRNALASRPAAPAPAAGPKLRVDPASLDAEREEIAAALRAASEKEDQELRRMADELGRLVKELGAGGLPRGEALDHLAELKRKADEAATTAEALRRALAAAGKPLADSPPSTPLGQALQKGDAAGAESAARELAEREGKASAGERQRTAEALERASEAAARAAKAASSGEAPAADEAAASTATSSPAVDPTGEAEEKQRRLARDEKDDRARPVPSDGANARARKPDRHLERLERDLQQSAEACRRDPQSCQRQLDETADDLPKMQNEADRSAARQAFARSVRQLAERLKRGGASARKRGDGSGQERAFRKAAAGESTDGLGDEEASAGEPAGSDDRAIGAGRPGSASDGEGDANPGAAVAGAESGGRRPGDGIGSETGGDPLGERSTLTARGREREARLKNGTGPTRSEVIEGAARKGFASTRYRGVFDDYSSVVEETLDATDTPAGRRYLVRRYFQLIRPRTR